MSHKYFKVFKNDVKVCSWKEFYNMFKVSFPFAVCLRFSKSSYTLCRCSLRKEGQSSEARHKMIPTSRWPFLQLFFDPIFSFRSSSLSDFEKCNKLKKVSKLLNWSISIASTSIVFWPFAKIMRSFKEVSCKLCFSWNDNKKITSSTTLWICLDAARHHKKVLLLHISQDCSASLCF